MRDPDRSAPDQAQLTLLQIEKKKQEYERLLSQKRRFELEMAKLDQAQRREEQELAQMQEDLAFGTGHQSEPTTPPEYRETTTGFPTLLSRPNRYSTSSILSPPGLFSRGVSGGALASPQATAMAQTRFALDDQLPLRMQPSRRDSDDDDKELAVRQDPTSHRSTNHLNRYSMPVTRSRNGFYDLASLDQTNTARFLFGDDESSLSEQQYAIAQAAQDESYSAPSRNDIERHSSVSSVTGAPTPSASTEISNSRPASIRHSLDLKSYQDNMAETSAANSINSPPKLQASFSANDIPTVKSNGAAPINNHAQQHLHHHNASIGRIPAGAIQARHNRELSTDVNTVHGGRDQAAAYGSIGSALQGNSQVFGGPPTTGAMAPPQAASAPPMNVMGHYTSIPHAFSQAPMTGSANAFQQLTMNMANMQLGNPAYSQGNYGSFNNSNGTAGNYTAPAGQVAANSQQRDSQQRVIQNRRAMDNNESMARFHGKSVADFAGKIYETCKDQYGCRFLQRELEHRKPAEIHAVWLETHQHVVELMMDPFGNYLCQKLLEFCTEEERTALVENAARDMVRIALNQHGTRALQKMIEHVHTPEQVQMITNALRNKVVDLIQDLNGNHVIQKCLNKLSSDQAGFIFKAVGNNCVEVGTHRHGCCVLQRCIDHAAGTSKTWLIDRIIQNSTSLITDPFGNYVVQYIIDLDEPTFTDQLVHMFNGNIVAFSKHKFASNVMEKCIRCAQNGSKDLIVVEILNSGEMDRILKDSYANYVVQTALDYATPDMKIKLVQTIRPLLTSIRNTPYGRRIATKVNTVEQQAASPHPLHPNGQIVRVDPNGGQVALRPLAPGTNRSIIFSQPMDDGSGMNGGHSMAPMSEPNPPPQYNMNQGNNMRHQMMQPAPQHMMYPMPMGQMGQVQVGQMGQMGQMAHMGQMTMGQMGPMGHHQQMQPRQTHTPVPRSGTQVQVRYPNQSGRPTPPMDGESSWV
jgi:hypothetical protein